MTALFLIGPRGAGKTSAGALAAARIQIPFVDVDAQIEDQTGRSVAAIFEGDGESTFRRLEHQAMLALLEDPRPHRVVATGGGSVLDTEVREKLALHEGVIWLTAAPGELRLRIRGSARPSLTGVDPARELPDVVQKRQPLYRAASVRGIVVDTDGRSVEEVAGLLVQRFFSLATPDEGGKG